MTKITGEEISNDLYRTCETPLKKKVIASNKIEKMIKMTKPEVMIQEIDRICMPMINIIVERNHFRGLGRRKMNQ